MLTVYVVSTLTGAGVGLHLSRWNSWPQKVEGAVFGACLASGVATQVVALLWALGVVG